MRCWRFAILATFGIASLLNGADAELRGNLLLPIIQSSGLRCEMGYWSFASIRLWHGDPALASGRFEDSRRMSVLIHEQNGRRTIYYPDDRHLR